MDRGDVEEAGRVERNALATTTTMVALLSFLSLLYSYFFSGLSSYNNIQFSTLIFSLFAHAIDRKYVFLICNGIVAFLVKSLTFTSSSPGISQTPPTLLQENVASVECGVGEEEEETDAREECIYRAAIEEDEDEDEDEEDEGGEGESRVDEVSTEELNHKFEEFIKKMKEEIRVEAKQPLIAV